LNAYDPDTIENVEVKVKSENSGSSPVEIEKAIQEELEAIRNDAAVPFTGELNEYIENVRKAHEQIIDNINQDNVIKAEWDAYSKDKAKEVVKEFEEYIKANKDEIMALSIFYDQPYRRRELTFKMIKDLLEKLKMEKPLLAPHYVWEAYEQIDEVKGNSPKSDLVALVSLIRKVTGIDQYLTPYNKTVDRNFQEWIFSTHSGAGEKFSEEQMDWLRMIKDHIASSFHLEMDDLDYTPFDSQGGRGKMYQLFGDRMNKVIDELNEVLAA